MAAAICFIFLTAVFMAIPNTLAMPRMPTLLQTNFGIMSVTQALQPNICIAPVGIFYNRYRNASAYHFFAYLLFGIYARNIYIPLLPDNLIHEYKKEPRKGSLNNEILFYNHQKLQAVKKQPPVMLYCPAFSWNLIHYLIRKTLKELNELKVVEGRA
jgi:hypothetical protein